MENILDTSKTWAVCLEGGGARGAYQVGVWRALDEAGLRYDAVSGTSVGALNGALMASRDLDGAIDAWENIEFSKVMNVDAGMMKKLLGGDVGLPDLPGLSRFLLDTVREGGLDVEPLRRWMEQVVDTERLLGSDVELYITTFSLTDRRELSLRIKDLAPGQINDMLLASAYFPAFRNEKLGGKRYTDGGVGDVLPIDALLRAGKRNILAIRLHGFGVEKPVRIPKGTELFVISPRADIGSIMDFSPEQSRRNIRLGYFDGQRALLGLLGRKYYLRREIREEEAFDTLTSALRRAHPEAPLRDINETHLPRLTRRAAGKGSYHDALIALMEDRASEMGIDEFQIMSDRELLSRLSPA